MLDPNARSTRCSRNPPFLSSTLERHYIHRAEALAVCPRTFFINPLSLKPASNRFCAERLQSLIRTLQLNRLDEHSALQKVASFATLVSTYEKGLCIREHSHYLFIFNIRISPHTGAI